MKYYCVAKGRCPGIYLSWDECKAQTNGYPNYKFKSFDNMTISRIYMGAHCRVKYTEPRKEYKFSKITEYFETKKDTESKQK